MLDEIPLGWGNIIVIKVHAFQVEWPKSDSKDQYKKKI